MSRNWLIFFGLVFVLSAQAADVKASDLLAVRSAGKKLLPLQTKMGPVSPGDWLASHPEPGQKFDEYLASNPNRPNAQCTTIYIQPIGEFTAPQKRLLDDTVEVMSVFFGVAVKTLVQLPLELIPASARRVHPSWGVPQTLTGYVLNEVLMPHRPKDAVAVLALTTSDLWPGENWNFVFGQASLEARVGVWSLARFGDPEKDYAQTLRRTLATATHETGHMLGIPHCIAFECGMNGSNSLPEYDRRLLGFCSECEQKVWWACGVDPVKRYKALSEFSEKRKLEREAREWRAAHAALKSQP